MAEADSRRQTSFGSSAFTPCYSHPFVRSSTISSEHSAFIYLSTCQDMAQSVLTEEWVLGPEGTPFYTKRVRMLFPISPPFFFPLVK